MLFTARNPSTIDGAQFRDMCGRLRRAARVGGRRIVDNRPVFGDGHAPAFEATN